MNLQDSTDVETNITKNKKQKTKEQKQTNKQTKRTNNKNLIKKNKSEGRGCGSQNGPLMLMVYYEILCLSPQTRRRR